MLANEERHVRVSVAGVNTQMENTLRFFFRGPCKGRCEIVADESAEVSIIDIDAYKGKDYLDECRQRHPGRPLILLSFDDIGDDVNTTLRKPLKPDALLNALSKAMDARFCTVRPEVTTSSVINHAAETRSTPRRTPIVEEPTVDEALIEEPAVKSLRYPDEQVLLNYLELVSANQTGGSTQYDTADYLQGHLLLAAQKAKQLNRSIKLELTGGNIVVTPPVISEAENTPATPEGPQRVMVNMTNEVFTSFARRPLHQRAIRFSRIKDDCPHEGGAGTLAKDIDTIVWESAIWASSGRLPIGTSLTDPVQLDRWPNMTRLMLIPGSMRIAALWLEHPLSLPATSRMLGMPESCVFTFFSSLSAVGLARTCARDSQSHERVTGTASGAVVAKPKSGILGRILNRLRRK